MIMAGLTEELPFSRLTDYELSEHFQSTRQVYFERLENNGLKDFIKLHSTPFDHNEETLIDCKYFDIDQYNVLLNERANTNALSFMHLNIRRIARNKGELIAFLSNLDHRPDVLILSEIGNDALHYITPSYFPEYHKPHVKLPINNAYGGVAILVNKNLNPAERRDSDIHKTCNCSKCNWESTWVDLKINSNNYTIGAIYRHPHSDPTHFNDELHKTLSELPKSNICVTAGDTNIDLINYETNHVSDYLTAYASFDFLPFITIPSRITHYSATLIDHIFVRFPNKMTTNKISSGNLFVELTDHLPNFLIMHDKENTVKDRPFTRIFSDKNISAFKNKLSDINWEYTLNANDTNSMCDIFYQTIQNAFENSFPLVRISRKKIKDKRWLTHCLKTSINTKNKLYKKQLVNPSNENVNNYKVYKNILSTCLKDAEVSYFRKLFENKKQSVRKFWKTLGKTINAKRNEPTKKINKLIIDGETITDDMDMANAMNSFFCSIGENISRSFQDDPNTLSQYRRYMKNKVTESFFLQPIIERNVEKQISKLKINKSSGPDNISNKIIKACSTCFLTPLTMIYNSAFISGMYPTSWKQAKVIAMYKKGSHSDPNNYRPISLLSSFGKILERLIYDQMMSFIKKHSILFVYQYGFRQKHSTTLALVDIIDKIKNNLDENKFGIGIFLDVKKAFDTVNHEILFDKLEFYGFRGHSLSLLKSYLTGRTQFCTVNGKNSESLPIRCGVPQGSVLGPLLFILYVNDIQHCINKEYIKLFADDTGIFIFNHDLNLLLSEASNNMKKIDAWFSANKLALSLEKTNFLLFHGKNKKNPEHITQILFDQKSIPRISNTKYIGLIIDENLTWELHVNDILKKLYKFFGIFYNLRDFINKDLIRTVYFACIFPNIKYGIEVYGNCAPTLLKKIQIFQNKVLRVICKKDRYYNSTLLHSELDLLPVSKMRDLFLLKFVHSCVLGQPIDAFKNYFKNVEHEHNTRSQSHGQLERRNIRTELGRSTAHFSGATLWNSLPPELKLIQTEENFKKAIQIYLKDNQNTV